MSRKELQSKAQGQFEKVQVSGEVVKEPYAVGSKSEREAIFLHTPEENYLLRRQGGNPFYDSKLEELVGKQINCSGILTNQTLIISDWNETETKDKPQSQNKSLKKTK